MSNGWIRALILAVVFAASNVFAQSETHTIRVVVSQKNTNSLHDSLGVFKNYVETASNGLINVELSQTTDECKNATECLELISTGKQDIYYASPTQVADIFPYVQVLDLPYIFADDIVAEHVLLGDFSRVLRDMVLKDSGNKIRLMTIGNAGGWRNFANTLRPFQIPEDMVDIKIYTELSDIPHELINELGAVSTSIPYIELYASLQTGGVDGVTLGISEIMEMNFVDAGLKYVTMDRHIYMSQIWWMSNETFLGLPEDLRHIILDGFHHLQSDTFVSSKRSSLSAFEKFVRQGGELYNPKTGQLKLFKTAAAPIYDWFKKQVEGGDKVYDSLMDSVVAAEAQKNTKRLKDTE